MGNSINQSLLWKKKKKTNKLIVNLCVARKGHSSKFICQP